MRLRGYHIGKYGFESIMSASTVGISDHKEHCLSAMPIKDRAYHRGHKARVISGFQMPI
jgi:hypothetical protein